MVILTQLNNSKRSKDGRSPYRIMVCTPCHSDVTMHYTQAVLKFQQECMQRKYKLVLHY